MSDPKSVKPSSLSRIAWATGALCIACCAVPFVGIAMGSAALSAFSFYSEAATTAIAVLVVMLLAYKYISRKKTPSCDLDCSCRPPSGQDSTPKID